jgi:peptidoglycan/LPS O-acetylase OafA/YrhL
MIYFLQMTPEQQAFLGYALAGIAICFGVMGLGIFGHWLCERAFRRRLERWAEGHRRVLQGRVDPTLAHHPHFEDTVRMPGRERDAEDTQPPYHDTKP